VERVEIGGMVQALTPKAALIHDYGAELWIPRKFCRVVAGELVRGCAVGWLALSAATSTTTRFFSTSLGLAGSVIAVAVICFIKL
jgi:hypothetical protein